MAGPHDIEHIRAGLAAERSDRQPRAKLLEEALELSEGCQLPLEPGSGRGMQGGRDRPGSDRLGRGLGGGCHGLWAEFDSVNSEEPIEQCSRPNACCGCWWGRSNHSPTIAGKAQVGAILFPGLPISFFLGVRGRMVIANGEQP